MGKVVEEGPSRHVISVIEVSPINQRLSVGPLILKPWFINISYSFLSREGQPTAKRVLPTFDLLACVFVRAHLHRIQYDLERVYLRRTELTTLRPPDSEGE